MYGYRGSRSEWDAEREPRAGFGPGAVYGPDVRPGQPKYSVVMWHQGVASSFTLNFPAGTTLEQARAAALGEMPEGAFIAQTRNDDEGVALGIGGTTVLSDGYWPTIALKLENNGDVRWAGFGSFTEGQLPPP